MSTDTIPIRPNGHDRTAGPSTAASDTCPYCGAPLSTKLHHEIRQRLAQEEEARLVQHDQQMHAGFEREIKRTEARYAAAIEKIARDAATTSEKRLEALRQTQDAVVAARVAKEREKAAKEVSKAVTQERLQHAAEKLKLEQKLEDLKRRVQAKTANAIGEPGEVDLHTSLVAAFPGDRISRVPKGAPGADVIFEVIEHGEVCGKIILDSKCHKSWLGKFTSKLRSDMLATNADFGILVSEVFWAGAPSHVALRDSVIVTTPGCVVVLVELLRQIVIDHYKLKLSNQARDEKAERALSFLVSPKFNDLIGGWLKLTTDLAALDLTEQKAHQTTWEKRAALIEAVGAVREKFIHTVADIIGGSAR